MTIKPPVVPMPEPGRRDHVKNHPLRDLPADRRQPHPAIVVLLCVALVAATSWGAHRDDTARAELAAHRASSVTLAACPPPAPGLTDTVLLVVESRADAEPVVTGCSRIAARSRVWP